MASVVLGKPMPQRDNTESEQPGQSLVEASTVAILPVLSPGRATGGGGSEGQSMALKSDIEALMARMEMVESEHAKKIEALKRQHSEFRKKVELHITTSYIKFKVQTDLK